MMTLVKERRIDEARALQRRLMPLARSVGTSYGVPGLKAALELIDYVGGAPRPPLRPVNSEVIEIIRGQLNALNSTHDAATCH
jgi:4-hydroxy-2-oxoglutarate aldolase